MSLFVSYSRADTPIVRRLHAGLQAHGRETWVDWEGIPPSADWMREIETAIDAADAVVFVMSPSSLASVVCARELAHAHAQRKRVLPVVIRDAGDTPVPAELARLNWIFLREGDEFDAGVARLLEAADTDLDWVHAHTRLLVRAREWQASPGDASLLLRGRDLRSAEQWLAVGPTKTPSPTAEQAELIMASRRHATRQRTLWMSVGGVALAAIAVVGSVAILAHRESQRQEAMATVRRLAAASERVREQQPPDGANVAPAERSLQLAAEAIRRLVALGQRSFDADLALRRALQQSLEPVRSIPLPVATRLAALVVRNDGQLAWVANDPWIVARWTDAGGGTRVLTAGRHAYPDPTLSPDGRWAAAVLDDGSGRHVLAVRAVGNETPSWQVDLEAAAIGVAVAPDGTVAVAVADDRRGISRTRLIRPGDLQSRPALPFLYGPAFSADGRWLAGLLDDGGIGVWTIEAARSGDARPSRRVDLPGASKPTFSVDSQYLLVPHGEQPERVAVVSLADAGAPKVFTRNAPNSVGPGGRYWIEPDAGVTLAQLLRADTGLPLGRLLRQAEGLAVFSPDGKLVAVEQPDAVDLWRVQPQGSALVEFDAGRESMAIALDAGGSSLLALRGATLTRWTVGSADAPSTRLLGEPPERAAFSADGRWLALVQHDRLRVVDTANGGERLLVKLPRPVHDLALSPKGETLVSIDDQGRLTTWSVASGALVPAAERTASDVAHLAVGDGGGPVTLFHFEGNRRIGAVHTLRSWPMPDSIAPASSPLGRERSGFAATPCGVSPDGRLAAMALADSLVVRDTRTGADVAVVDEAAHPPLCSFSADGQWLATTGPDRTLRVWEVSTRQEQARLELQAPARAIVFAAGGTRVAVLDEEGAVRVWPLTPVDLLAQACRRMRHGMSEEDWQRFHPEESYRATCDGLTAAPGPG
ncbi:TIR domain-containing protein [Ideonella sp. YS5]|uniref:TIR domain-containing protein n=1 Tax=Ideonella sp. YS5 TaxID=3453714 RepID=UPI003EEB7639